MEYQKLLLGDHSYFISAVKSSFGPHCHNELEILFCKEGSFSVVIDKIQYDLQSGCAIFINTIEEHEIILGSSDVEILVIEFGISLLGIEFQIISTCKFLNPLINLNMSEMLPPNIIERLRDIFEMLYQENTYHADGFTWMIQAGLFELSTIILRYFPMEKDANSERQKRIHNFLKIQKVFQLVEKNYQQPISLKEAADYVDYETKSFCRIFKDTTNMTFHKYLNLYRIDIAIKLLQYHKYSINEIAQYCGIPVSKTFSRIFHEVTGMTPTEYRKVLK